MVSSRPEVEWDEVERGWMLALAEWRDGLCPLCGGPREECSSIDNENAYTVPPPSRCHKTTALERAQQARRGDSGKPNPATKYDRALLWAVMPRNYVQRSLA